MGYQLASQSGAWAARRRILVEELENFVKRSPILELVGPIRQDDDEIRAIICIEVATLVKPDNDAVVKTAGPTVIALRYHKSFLYEAPPPWGIVSVVYPKNFMHANQHPIGGLCLGAPSPAIGMEPILHLTFAAITLSSYTAEEWLGLNPPAADFIRRHARAFPLFETGLLETPPAAFHRPYEQYADEIRRALRKWGWAQ